MVVVFLLAMAMLLAMSVLAHRSQHWPDCTGKVVALTGRHGEPVECVCFSGTLATCFEAGP